MSRPPRHCYNPHSRRILCQRCHKSPASYSILTQIRLCAPCAQATFAGISQKHFEEYYKIRLELPSIAQVQKYIKEKTNAHR